MKEEKAGEEREREERGLSGEERGDWKGERRTNEKMTGSGDEEEGGWGWG